MATTRVLLTKSMRYTRSGTLCDDCCDAVRGSQNLTVRSHEPVMSTSKERMIVATGALVMYAHCHSLWSREKFMLEMESECCPKWVVFSVGRSNLV